MKKDKTTINDKKNVKRQWKRLLRWYSGLAASFLVLFFGIWTWNHYNNNDNHDGHENNAFATLLRNRAHPTSRVKQTNYFPALEDAQEMARLSLLVYLFRHETEDGTVCQRIQAGNYTLPNDDAGQPPTPGPEVFPDLRCHWYYHDRESQGTQVMIVSSAQRNHLTVVFAGTDDVQTSLVDSDVRWEVFGDDTHWKLPPDSDADDTSDADVVKVHAGFDHAVFANDLMDQIVHTLEHLRKHDKKGLGRRRIYCTGHSLGAAAAVLTTIALTDYYHPASLAETAPTETLLVGRPWWDPRSWRYHHNDAPKPDVITTINFGCPRMGNMAYRNFMASRQERVDSRMHVWRIVLGWDLVPRLPDFFQHAGHTLQISVEDEKTTTDPKLANHEVGQPQQELIPRQEDPSRTLFPGWAGETNKTRVALAYYQHYGNETLGYAGVPVGWGSRPYIWVPGALMSHHIQRYRSVLEEWTDDWVQDFVRLEPIDSDDATTTDDDYDTPPFDDFPGPLVDH